MRIISPKLILILVIIVAIFIAVHVFMDKRTKDMQVASGINYLESFKLIINDYYNSYQQMPPVGIIFGGATNPESRSGCDVAGSCDLYYETTPDRQKAFMAMQMLKEHKYKYIYVAFVVENDNIETYCGPWKVGDLDYLQVDVYPLHCHNEVSKIIGIKN